MNRLTSLCLAAGLSFCCTALSAQTLPSSADDGFVLTASLQADKSLIGKDYTAIHSYMRKYGWDYSEHPNSSSKDHNVGSHCQVVTDDVLGEPVFRFIVHANEEALDGDRGSVVDRQRNEMKSQTKPEWSHLNGNLGERQRLQWKFRLPVGFRPSSSFCHIHQLKAQEGNNGAPLITITPRSNSNGSNRRIQVIHTGDTNDSSRGTLVDNLPLEDFEGEWILVTTEMLYDHDGEFRVRMERLSDGKVLVNKAFKHVDLWRTGATNIRNKFGIYRSFGSKMTSPSDRPTNGIKDETMDITDIRVYEKQQEPDGVETVKTSCCTAACYDLQGRRLARAAAHGIFIQEGKKIVR